MNIGAFRDAQDDVSMGRIIAFASACLGVLVAMNGLALMWIELLRPIASGAHLTEPLEVIGLGVTLVGGAVGMKGWQTQLENQAASPGAASAESSPPSQGGQ